MTVFVVVLATILFAAGVALAWVVGFRQGAAVAEADLLEKFRRKFGVPFEDADGPGTVE